MKVRSLSSARRWVCVVLIAACCPLMMNCYGRFTLTRTVYDLNGRVATRLLRQVVFWVFALVGVYGIAILADVVVLNVIDYWFGISVAAGTYTDDAGRTIVFQPSPDGRSATLSVSRDGAELARAEFVRVSDELCEIHDADGRLVGTARRWGADLIEVADRDGRVVQSVSRGDLEALRALAGAGLDAAEAPAR